MQHQPSEEERQHEVSVTIRSGDAHKKRSEEKSTWAQSQSDANTDKLKSISHQLTFNYLSRIFNLLESVWRMACAFTSLIFHVRTRLMEKRNCRCRCRCRPTQWNITRLQCWRRQRQRQRNGINLINLFIFKLRSWRWLLLSIEFESSNFRYPFETFSRFRLLFAPWINSIATSGAFVCHCMRDACKDRIRH